MSWDFSKFIIWSIKAFNIILAYILKNYKQYYFLINVSILANIFSKNSYNYRFNKSVSMNESFLNSYYHNIYFLIYLQTQMEKNIQMEFFLIPNFGYKIAFSKINKKKLEKNWSSFKFYFSFVFCVSFPRK